MKDEFFATVAGCTLAAAIGKYRMPGNKLMVESVYLYIRDTFDFLNDNGGDQYLGHWNHTGFDVFYSHQLSDKKNEIIAASAYIAAPLLFSILSRKTVSTQLGTAISTNGEI